MKFLFLLLCLNVASANENIEQEIQKAHEEVQKVLGGLQEKMQAANGDKMALVRQKAFALATDQRFLQAAEDIWTHPNRKTLLWVELGWFLFMVLIKAWRQAKANHWFKKFMVGFFLSLFTWLMMVLAIPAIILGEPFHIFVGTLWRVLLSGLF